MHLEATLPTLLRLRAFLRSTGRYGPSPFLIGHYGCIGDIAQGFCRAAAVSGGVYILGRKIAAVTSSHTNAPIQGHLNSDGNPNYRYTVELEDFPDSLNCHMIISSSSYIPPQLKDRVHQLSPPHQSQTKSDVTSIARCIAIIDRPLSFRPLEPKTEPIDALEAEGELDTDPASQREAVNTAILIFPPSSVSGASTSNAATALITGEGSLSTPKGKCKFF